MQGLPASRHQGPMPGLLAKHVGTSARGTWTKDGYVTTPVEATTAPSGPMQGTTAQRMRVVSAARNDHAQNVASTHRRDQV